MILAYIFNKCMPVALIIYFWTVLHRYYITRHVCFQYIFINYSKNRRHLGSALEKRRKYISSALGRCQHRIFEILMNFLAAEKSCLSCNAAIKKSSSMPKTARQSWCRPCSFSWERVRLRFWLTANPLISALKRTWKIQICLILCRASILTVRLKTVSRSL